ncbi:MAG TPA: HIT domain-containing protein, partial [Candidatus Paceibacterota bacterium]
KTELVGLLVSIGIQKIPAIIPVIKETDKAVAIKSPDPLATIDYLILPKKDIRDLGDLSADDRAYIDDTFLIISELVRDNHLTNYKIISNGPGFQTANYLHFHLLAQ